MIRRLFCALCAVILLCGGANGEETQSLVRLHVVAADDSPEAQALKLELRDTCLKCAEICLSGAPDAEAAYMRLKEHLPDFQSACMDRAQALGYAGEIRAEAGIFDFPHRVYGRLNVPAGSYRALRITIGQGEGRNWWCVLYPGLCALDERAAEDPTGVLAWLRARFGGKAA